MIASAIRPEPAVPLRVIAVRGSVIDIAVPSGELPAINEALEIAWDGAWRLVVEVQSHLDPTSVRAVALQSSTGLRRGRRAAQYAASRRTAAGA